MPSMPVTRSMSSSGGWVLAVAEGSADGHSVGHSTTRHAAGRDGISRTAHWT
jgi:hypothetical protein